MLHSHRLSISVVVTYRKLRIRLAETGTALIRNWNTSTCCTAPKACIKHKTEQQKQLCTELKTKLRTPHPNTIVYACCKCRPRNVQLRTPQPNTIAYGCCKCEHLPTPSSTLHNSPPICETSSIPTKCATPNSHDSSKCLYSNRPWNSTAFALCSMSLVCCWRWRHSDSCNSSTSISCMLRQQRRY